MDHIFTPPEKRDGDSRLFFSSPKPPPRNAALERKQEALLDAQLAQASQPVEMPAIAVPAPAPPPPPPPSTSSADQQEAGTEARRQAQQRRGIKSTILAGETGGYKPKTQILG
jgi:hypothetical protein